MWNSQQVTLCTKITFLHILAVKRWKRRGIYCCILQLVKWLNYKLDLVKAGCPCRLMWPHNKKTRGLEKPKAARTLTEYTTQYAVPHHIRLYVQVQLTNLPTIQFMEDLVLSEKLVLDHGLQLSQFQSSHGHWLQVFPQIFLSPILLSSLYYVPSNKWIKYYKKL